MAGTTPHVERDTLTVGTPGAEHAIDVGTPAWFRWLETATAFTFVSSQGTFTARRERASNGRGGWYWRAYQRRAGVRRRAYLGKAEELTLEQLHAVAGSLTNPATPTAAPTRRVAATIAPIDDTHAKPTLPMGTVTFLFTDIEGSTQLWEQHPHVMPTVLARHNSLLRRPIDIHGGVMFKTVGDSVHAAFSSAADALAAALAIQRSLQQEAWDLPTPLRVRMALHSGTAEPRDGDYVGPPQGRITRLLALGHGGQVLLSASTAQLVRDQIPFGVTLREMGSYQLTELAHPDTIFQLISPDLPSNFPPLRGASAVPRVDLLATKLYMPRPRPNLVARPRLFARLDTGLQSALTLVCAPAGFGKTTLLADWLTKLRIENAELRKRGQTDNTSFSNFNSQFKVAWLALDARDSDPAVFLRYLVAALQLLAPAVGTTTLTLLQSPQPPQPETLLTVLINDLDTLPQHSILVLDDYHTLKSPAIQQAVSFLIDHLPPALHLVIATREDPPLPLARLRACRQIAELRAEQLRFTAEEAATFLTELMGLPLTTADIAALETRTEGWIAGLQLAALAMQDRADYTGFMAAFTGSNRFIVDYLADEVLSRQPLAIQTFLLQTSILDRMCGPLCDAVIGGWGLGTGDRASDSQSPIPNPQSQVLLEQLERANLFVTPLDAARRWYRYHHLFGEVLRERLRNGATTAEVATLHRRASAWYEQHDLLPEAVQHALAADDYSLAARLIELLARPMQLRGEMITVMGWLAALPNDVLRTHAHLGVIYAWGLATTGQVPVAELWIQDVERSLAEHPDPSDLLGEVTVIRVVIALVQGDYPRTLTLGGQALTYLSDEQLPLRALTNMSLGAAHTAQGDLEAACQSLAQASTLYQAAGHIELALAPLRQLCRVQLVRGRMNQLEQTAQHALRLASQWGQRSSLVGYTYLSLGELCYQHNDLAAAERYFANGLALVDLGGTKDIMNVINLADGHLGVARVKHVQGDPEGALEHIRRIELIVEQLAIRMQPRERQTGPDSARPTPLLSYFDLIAAFRVRLWLSQGDIATASQWMQTSGMRVEGDIALSQEVGFITLARVLIAQGEYERTLALLARLLVATEAGGRMGRVIELLALQALALQAHGRETEALGALERALLLAEPEGYIRIFVDEGLPMETLLRAAHARSSAPHYVEMLLAAFPHDDKLTRWQGDKVTAIHDQTVILSPPHLVTPSLVEPLSERELEVLQLLVAGLSNQEIASRLVVALSTVKKHLNNVYTKLEVESRTQATARARELHLV